MGLGWLSSGWTFILGGVLVAIAAAVLYMTETEGLSFLLMVAAGLLSAIGVIGVGVEIGSERLRGQLVDQVDSSDELVALFEDLNRHLGIEREDVAGTSGAPDG